MLYLGIYSPTRQIALVKVVKNKIKILHLDTVDRDVKPLYIIEALLNNRPYRIVSGLEVQDVFLRKVHIELQKKRDILKILPFQIEEMIPIPEEDAIILPSIEKQGVGSEVFLAASSKKALILHKEKIAIDGLEPDIVSCVPLALFRYARELYPQHPSLFIYHDHSFVVIQAGKLEGSKKIKEGDFGRMSAYFKKKYPDIHHILFTGEARIQTNDFISLESDDPMLDEFAVPIGLGIDAALRDEKSCQFLKKEFESEKVVHLRKRSFVKYYAASALLSLIILMKGNAYLHKKETKFLERIGEKKALNQVVKGMSTSLVHHKKLSIPTSQTIAASELLAYLSSHPILNEKCEIIHLKYEQDVKPKIDLEFRTSSPELARKFRTDLMKNTEIVDKIAPVKWSSEHGKYKAIFYLKAKKNG